MQSTKVGNFQGILRFSLKTSEDKFNDANAFPKLSRGLMSSQPVRCKTNISIPAFTPGFQLVEYLSAISVATVCQMLSHLPLFHHTPTLLPTPTPTFFNTTSLSNDCHFSARLILVARFFFKFCLAYWNSFRNLTGSVRAFF